MTQPVILVSPLKWGRPASVAFRSIEAPGIVGRACRGELEVRLCRVLNSLQTGWAGSDGGWVLAKGCSELSEPHIWAAVASLSHSMTVAKKQKAERYSQSGPCVRRSHGRLTMAATITMFSA